MKTYNQISSIMVPKGFEIKLFEQTGFNSNYGNSIEFQGSCKCISLDNTDNLSFFNFSKKVNGIFYRKV